MKNALVKTDFKFPGQKSVYHGKVRDVYNIDDELLVMVVSDRISAFDVILPEGIPYKGQVLNQIAAKFLDATSDIVPNWKVATPDPMVTVGLRCEPFKVEMVVRGYLTGHAWREYKAGKRTLCGETMPEGMKENVPQFNVGDTVKADVFAAGEKVDVTGISKGHGYQGVIKRWNAGRSPMSHGAGPMHRHQGSMGACSDPSKIMKGKMMPGHMGAEQVTVQNLDVVKVDPELNLIAVCGAVPGPKGGIVVLKNTVKNNKVAKGEAGVSKNPQKASARK